MVNSFSKSIVNALVVSAILLLAGASRASAASTMAWSSSDIGEAQTINFDGISDAYFHHTTPIPGLSAQLVLTLDSVVNGDWTFGYDLTNTSTSPITSSRVTVFGFDSMESYAGVTSTGPFSSPGSGSTLILGNHNLCFTTLSFSQCLGNYFGGVAKGGSASGFLTLKYAAAQLSLHFSRLFVAYQGINAPQYCLCHQNGVGVGAVPEPATWAMMITGFGGIGAAMRRRRQIAEAA